MSCCILMLFIEILSELDCFLYYAGVLDFTDPLTLMVLGEGAKYAMRIKN